MASATSCHVSRRTSTVSAGSRVWSSRTTAPSSMRAIRSGARTDVRGGAITGATIPPPPPRSTRYISCMLYRTGPRSGQGALEHVDVAHRGRVDAPPDGRAVAGPVAVGDERERPGGRRLTARRDGLDQRRLSGDQLGGRLDAPAHGLGLARIGQEHRGEAARQGALPADDLVV